MQKKILKLGAEVNELPVSGRQRSEFRQTIHDDIHLTTSLTALSRQYGLFSIIISVYIYFCLTISI